MCSIKRQLYTVCVCFVCVFLRPPRRDLNPVPEPAAPPPSSSSASLSACATPAPGQTTHNELINTKSNTKLCAESHYS